MSRVLVIGAAGLVGSVVLEWLATLGPATTALILQPADVPADRVLDGEARDARVVAEAMTGADAVVHLAAIPGPG
jgi:nucleoside-diphosphate-sugar epimerase